MKKKPENPLNELGRLNAEAVALQPRQEAATKELEAGIEAQGRAIAAAQARENDRREARKRRKQADLTTKAKLTKQ